MTEKHETRTWEEIVRDAKKAGFTELPVGGSALESQVIKLFQDTKSIMTAKVVMDQLGEKPQKWYSDKLWQLEKKGILVVLARGYYKIKKA